MEKLARGTLAGINPNLTSSSSRPSGSRSTPASRRSDWLRALTSLFGALRSCSPLRLVRRDRLHGSFAARLRLDSHCTRRERSRVIAMVMRGLCCRPSSAYWIGAPVAMFGALRKIAAL